MKLTGEPCLFFLAGFTWFHPLFLFGTKKDAGLRWFQYVSVPVLNNNSNILLVSRNFSLPQKLGVLLWPHLLFGRLWRRSGAKPRNELLKVLVTRMD